MLVKVTQETKEKMLDYVKQEPAINLFIIGDVENYGVDQSFIELYLQYKENNITACILRYYKNVIIYSHTDDFNVSEIVTLMNTFTYTRFSGKKKVLDRIVPHINNIEKEETHYFCKLGNNKNLEKTDQIINKAIVSDLDRILPLMKEVGFATPEFYQSNTTKLEHKAGRIYFIEDENNRVFSSAATSIESSVSAMIGGVGTSLDYRKKGYASKVVSKLCEDLLAEGKTPCLFFNNPEAGSIYHRLGFVDIDRWTMVKLTS